MQFEPTTWDIDPSLYMTTGDLRVHGSRRLSNRNHARWLYGASATHINDHENRTFRTVVVPLIISGVVFLTILSIYEVFRNYISNHYAKIALIDPCSKNSKDTIHRTLIANYQRLRASIVFAIFCVIVVTIALYIYFCVI